MRAVYFEKEENNVCGIFGFVTKGSRPSGLAHNDALEQKLFLARDRFGIKPLYWTQVSTGLYFASEVKALLPFLDARMVNGAALSDYLTFQFCLGEKTLMDGLAFAP